MLSLDGNFFHDFLPIIHITINLTVELLEILAKNECLDTILVSVSLAFVGCLFADGQTLS